MVTSISPTLNGVPTFHAQMLDFPIILRFWPSTILRLQKRGGSTPRGTISVPPRPSERTEPFILEVTGTCMPCTQQTNYRIRRGQCPAATRRMNLVLSNGASDLRFLPATIFP